MTWQIALFLNAVFSTIRSGIQKKVVTRTDPQLFLFYVVCYIFVEILLLYSVINQRLPTLHPSMFLLGIVFAISTSCLFAAIRISLSQTSLIGTYAIIIPMILGAVLLGESEFFNPQTVKGVRSLIGILAAIISLWLMSRSKSQKKQETNRQWILLIIIYIFFDGIGQYWNKIFLVNNEPIETLFSQLIGNIPFLYLFLKFRNVPVKISVNTHKWVFFDSLAEVGFAIFILLSLKLGPLSVILPIQKLATIIGGMFLGLFVFHEEHELTKLKKAGLLIGLIGIIFLIF